MGTPGRLGPWPPDPAASPVPPAPQPTPSPLWQFGAWRGAQVRFVSWKVKEQPNCKHRHALEGLEVSRERGHTRPRSSGSQAGQGTLADFQRRRSCPLLPALMKQLLLPGPKPPCPAGSRSQKHGMACTGGSVSDWVGPGCRPRPPGGAGSPGGAVRVHLPLLV